MTKLCELCSYLFVRQLGGDLIKAVCIRLTNFMVKQKDSIAGKLSIKIDTGQWSGSSL